MAALPGDLPVHAFDGADAFGEWLAKHGAQPTGIWLKLTRKDSARGGITLPEAVDTALCHGWIDGQARALDAQPWLVRMTPRRSKSLWSAKNRARVAELEAAGRMQPAGRAAVAAAQADGRWDVAYPSPRDAAVSPELAAALAAHPFAEALFPLLDAANRFAILHRSHTPRTAQGRERAIERLVSRLAVGETPYPVKP